MTRIRMDMTVDAPRDEVWELLTDIERMPEYSTLTEEVTYISEGPVGEGTVWEEANPIGSIPTTGYWRVVEFDPPSHFVFDGDASFVNADVTFDLEDQNGKTELRQVTTYEFLPQLGFVGWLLDRFIFRYVLALGQAESLKNFKEMAESQGTEDE
ncbi:MAG: SRPBCC family protein [Halobacteria archaeon]|nr:SRPBCC family protein [Halobacteria archaeon]